MQVLEYKLCDMKRDMDLIRDILILINDDPKYDGTTEFFYETPEEMGIQGHTVEEVSYHLRLLIEAGFIEGAVTMMVPMQIIRKLTWQGHEFEANISSSTIWVQTKERVKDLPAVGIKVVAAIAEAFVKQHLKLP
jgi:hypothetical protein